MEYLGHGNSFFIFLVTLFLNSLCFPRKLQHFTFPPALCEGSSSSTSSSTLVMVLFLLAILVGMKLYLIVALIYVSLRSNDVEHLFMFLAHLYTSLEKCQFKSFAYFLNWVICPFLLNYKSSLFCM